MNVNRQVKLLVIKIGFYLFAATVVIIAAWILKIPTHEGAAWFALGMASSLTVEVVFKQEEQ